MLHYKNDPHGILPLGIDIIEASPLFLKQNPPVGETPCTTTTTHYVCCLHVVKVGSGATDGAVLGDLLTMAAFYTWQPRPRDRHGVGVFQGARVAKPRGHVLVR